VVQEAIPVINCLADGVIVCENTNGCGEVPDVQQFYPSLTEGNHVQVGISQSIWPGTVICSNTSMTLTVTNECGNSSSCSVSVKLVRCPQIIGVNPPQIVWTVNNLQLEQSTNLLNWTPIPGATNPPFVISNVPGQPKAFYRLTPIQP
jgi:hypothetical protein